ncbi:hypothetical protein [Pseudomonas spelaei]
MMRPDAKVEKVYLDPNLSTSENPSTAWPRWSSWTLRSRFFDPVLLAFLNKPRNRVKILYWERNGFLTGFGIHWAADELVGQLFQNGWKASPGLTGRFLFGRHTCTFINMLSPNTKFMTVPA